jgi:LEA14-like dessication related protein
MSKRRIAAFFLLTFMIIPAGCTAYKLLHSTKLEPPKIEFYEYRIKQVTDEQAEVDFIVRAENPNPIGINGVSADYELFIEESRFAAGKAVEAELPPGSETTLTVPVVVVYEELLNAIGPAIERLLSNQKSMPITVKVRVYGNPRLYSDTQEGFLPPFEKRITRTIDIPLPEDEINQTRDRLEKAIRRLF